MRRRRSLRIDLGERVVELQPGDTLLLEHVAVATVGATKSKASVTWKYTWDGHTLKKVWE